MTSLLVVVGAFYVVSLTVLAASMLRAPEGYEDDGGFHQGRSEEA